MNNNCIVACRDKIVIGEGTEFGPAVYLYDHDHIHSYVTGKNDGYNTQPIMIGKNCWIGANTVLLKGTVLGDNCVVGAGSVVTKDIPAGYLAYGNPCKPVRPITEADSMLHLYAEEDLSNK